MRGIRIESDLSFLELFTPIFTHIRGLTWLVHPESFRWLPEEWTQDYDEATEQFTSGIGVDFVNQVHAITTQLGNGATIDHGYCARTDIFPKFGAAVSDDWCSFFGIAGEVSDPKAWFNTYYLVESRPEYLVQSCQVVLMCVDGAYWEFYAKDDSVGEPESAHSIIDELSSYLVARKVEHSKCVLENAVL